MDLATEQGLLTVELPSESPFKAGSPAGFAYAFKIETESAR